MSVRPPATGENRASNVTPIRPRSLRIAGSDAPEKTVVNVGFVPLVDCAAIAVAVALGFDRKHGITLRAQRNASWAAVRDKLASGAIDAAHCLYGLVYDVHLGVLGPREEMAVLMGLNQNGQAITLAGHLRDAGVTDAASLSQYVENTPRTLSFAQTFPTGTHAMWLNYWLAAHGIDPLTAVQTVTVPPPQIVTHMRLGAIDGSCVGEPWSGQAVREGVGFTVATSQQIWPDHPEKVLASTAAFTREYPNTARALIMTLLDAARYIDNPAHADEVARIVASRAYINTDVEQIAQRLRGVYQDGLGHSWQDAHALRFFGNGEVTYPWLSDGMWFLTQFQRWGLIGENIDHLAIARQVQQTSLYSEAATALRIAVPTSTLRSSTLIDGRVWDGTNPSDYARGFEIRMQALDSSQHTGR